MRWVKPGNMHLTLRFLGATPPAKVAALATTLGAVAAGQAPLKMALDGLGGFPSRRRPQVLWVGLGGDRDGLTALQGAVEGAVGALGWPAEERAFRPHVTLGRVRGKQRPPAAAWQPEVPPLSFELDAVELVESRLQPSGAVYRVLCRAELGQVAAGPNSPKTLV